MSLKLPKMQTYKTATLLQFSHLCTWSKRTSYDIKCSLPGLENTSVLDKASILLQGCNFHLWKRRCFSLLPQTKIPYIKHTPVDCNFPWPHISAVPVEQSMLVSCTVFTQTSAAWLNHLFQYFPWNKECLCPDKVYMDKKVLILQFS